MHWQIMIEQIVAIQNTVESDSDSESDSESESIISDKPKVSDFWG